MSCWQISEHNATHATHTHTTQIQDHIADLEGAERRERDAGKDAERRLERRRRDAFRAVLREH